MADIDYKFLGLLAVFILAAGLAFIVIKWPKSIHATFSQHVAVRNQSTVYYVALFGVVLPLLLLFFTKWFIPEFELSVWFGVFIVVSMGAQFLCTLIPEVGGWRSTYHRLLAGISGILLIPALALTLVPDNIAVQDKALTSLGLCVMLLIVLIVTVRKGKPRYFLLLQIAYFTAFFVPILNIVDL
jgi:uncharacterized membrane protein